MAHGQAFGLVPVLESLQPDTFKLEAVDVILSSRGFLVETKSKFTYRLETEVLHPIRAQFVFPYEMNEVALTVHHVRASIQEAWKPEIVISTEMYNPPTVDADRASGRIPSQAVQLGASHYPLRDFWRCYVGDIPSFADVIVEVNYVSYLDPEKDGKPSYTFPDMLQGRTNRARLSVIDHTCAVETVKPDEIESSFQWSITNSSEIQMNTVTGRTDFDLKGKVWAWNGLGQLRTEYEPRLASLEPGDRSGLLAVSVTAPPDPPTPGTISKKVEVLFFVDCSGSMRSGDKIQHAAETLLLFLKSLPIGCYFNIVRFGSNFDTLFKGESAAYGEETLKKGVQYQSSLAANMGGTNLTAPLGTLLGYPVKSGCKRIVFVMTDGHVNSDTQCLKLAKQHASSTRIFPFGIGNGVSRNFIENFGKAAGGLHEFTTTNDRDMETKVMRTLHVAMAANTLALKWDIKVPKGFKIDTSALPGLLRPGERKFCVLEVLGNATPSQHKASLSGISVVMGTEHEQHKFNSRLDLRATSDNASVHRIHAVKQADELTKREDLVGFSGNHVTAANFVRPFGIAARFLSIVSTRESYADGDTIYPTMVVGYGLSVASDSAARINTLAATPAPIPAPIAPAVAPAVIRAPIKLHGVKAKRIPVLRDNINGINNRVVRRLGARGGVSRMSALTYDEVRLSLKEFLSKIIKDSILYADHEMRKTVLEEDVDKALKNNGIKMYGIEEYAPAIFEGDSNPRRRRTGGTVRRTTPFGRPDATSSGVASLLGITRNDVQTAMAKPPPRKQASNTSNASTRVGPRLRKQSTLILDDSSAKVSSLVKKSSTRMTHVTVSRAKSTKVTKASFVSMSSKTSFSKTSNSSLSSRRSTPARRSARNQSTVPNHSHVSVDQTGTGTSDGVQPRGRKRKTTSPNDGSDSKTSRMDTSVRPVTGKGVVVGRGKGKTPLAKRQPKPQQLRVGSTRTRASTEVAPHGIPDFQAMISLISLQQFDGHWSLGKELGQLIKTTAAECLKVSPINDHETWATALAVTWLEQTFPRQRTEWEMIHYKAIKFMEGRDHQGLSVTELQQKAAHFLQIIL